MKSEITAQSVRVGSLASPEQPEHRNEGPWTLRGHWPHVPFHLQTAKAITPVAIAVKYSWVINKPQMPQLTPHVLN